MTQQQRSLLALVFSALFLITGKLFVWKKPQEPEPIQYLGTNPTDVTEPAQSSVPLMTDLTSSMPLQMTTVLTSSADAGITSTILTSTSQSGSASSVMTSTSALLTSTTQQSSAGLTTTTTTVTSTIATETTAKPAPSPSGFTVAPEGYFSDALFIGDSRTVGQALYSPIEGAVYFATVGMSTANIYKSTGEVSDTKGMNFESAISARQYGKVYLMLGINELGNDRTATIRNFGALVDRIRSAQPNAIIYIEANLHVTAARSAQNVYGVNNEQINAFNASISEFADGVNIFYLNVNPVFDDESNALNAELCRDGVHPIASNYAIWADWLRQNVIIR